MQNCHTIWVKGSEKVSERATVSEKLVAEFTENYMEKIFYFCLKRTGNASSAEDLMQDIALHTIAALNKGTNPENFSAWVWRIARNRYAMWADEKHRKAESIAAADIGDYEISDDNTNILDNMIRSEQLSLLRRELAFIASDYRNIVLAYYIEHQSVRTIALHFSLSESAVKERLRRARNILKEGMNMAREFGVRSYNPEEITFTNNCSKPGDKNQPYSIMEHKLYKNIFLEVYGNPSTAEALSLELGVALPYMENELEYLTRETVLLKTGDKYQTAFPIVSREAQERAHAAQLAAAPAITKALTSFADRLHAAFQAAGYAYYGSYQDHESAKWSLLMLAYDHFFHKNPRVHERTARPDHGSWDMIAYQSCDAKEPDFVGNHGSKCGFQQFKYEFDGIADRTPPYLTDAEAETLYHFAVGNATADDAVNAEALAAYGYLRQDGETYVPDVLVLRAAEIKQAFGKLDAATAAEISELAEDARKQLKALYDEIAETVKADLPALFAKDAYQCSLAIANMYHARGYVMAEALRSGWLTPAAQVSPAIGARLYM